MAKYQVGDKMPQFVFDTAYQTQVKIEDVLEGKTVFWVLRYIGCTVCRYDVHLIQERYQEFKDKNAKVFVVMQSDQQHIQNDLKDIQLMVMQLPLLNQNQLLQYRWQDLYFL